ncbi:MAG: ABC transporter substrate binding protein [Candidatus Omnitrophota bacterium]
MKKLIGLGLAILLVIAMPQSVFSEEGHSPKKVFIVHSYSPREIHGGMGIEMGMLDKLKQLGYEEGKDIEFSRFFMDTQTKYKTIEDVKMRAEMALAEIKVIDPDIIIVFDDNAFEHVGLPLAKTKYLILFNGVNLNPEYYDAKVDFMETREHPGYNITGIIEQSLPFMANQLMKRLLPQAKAMAAVCTTGYPFFVQMAKDFQEDIQAHPERYPLKLKKMYTTSSWEEYQKITLEINQMDDIDAVSHLCTGLYDKEGRAIPADEAVRWIVTHQDKPTFTPWNFFVDMGFLAAAPVDFELLGAKTAIQVHQVLSGESPGDIPIGFPLDFYIAINLARARQLGLEISLEILSEAREIFTEMSAYPEYRYKINNNKNNR